MGKVTRDQGEAAIENRLRAKGMDSAARDAYHEVRHQAAIKCWLKRKRKGEQAANQQQVGAAEAGARRVGRIDSKGQQSLGIGQVRSDWKADPYAELERRVKSTPQKSAKRLGGGVSESYKIVLEDGTEGNFKPAAGELTDVRDGIDKPHGADQGAGPYKEVPSEHGQMVERELGAWEVAKLVGMDDMVAPCFERSADVPGGGRRPRQGPKYLPGHKRGSFAVWQDGTPAIDHVGPPGSVYDGEEDLQRSAMFDYIIGNQDRHRGNWIVNKEGAIKLIDHGLAFGTGRTRQGATHFTDRVSRKLGQKSPVKFAENYVKNKSRIISALKKLDLPDEALRRVAARIDRAGSAKSWDDFILNAD